jgi:hypothetical protein
MIILLRTLAAPRIRVSAAASQVRSFLSPEGGADRARGAETSGQTFKPQDRESWCPSGKFWLRSRRG